MIKMSIEISNIFKVAQLIKVLGFLLSALPLIFPCLDTNPHTRQGKLKFHMNDKS